MAEKNNWQVYILKCSDGSLYAGVTTDLERRVQQTERSVNFSEERSLCPSNACPPWEEARAGFLL
ncbi:MAG: GIY-YIG nuclease family protein [Candidatus Moranbacteria bacterium]|nr:GIY-YIG nuclease family protein [Candidatus Moranbacteria bacterium]